MTSRGRTPLVLHGVVAVAKILIKKLITGILLPLNKYFICDNILYLIFCAYFGIFSKHIDKKIT